MAEEKAERKHYIRIDLMLAPTRQRAKDLLFSDDVLYLFRTRDSCDFMVYEKGQPSWRQLSVKENNALEKTLNDFGYTFSGVFDDEKIVGYIVPYSDKEQMEAISSICGYPREYQIFFPLMTGMMVGSLGGMSVGALLAGLLVFGFGLAAAPVIPGLLLGGLLGMGLGVGIGLLYGCYMKNQTDSLIQQEKADYVLVEDEDGGGGPPMDAEFSSVPTSPDSKSTYTKSPLNTGTGATGKKEDLPKPGQDLPPVVTEHKA